MSLLLLQKRKDPNYVPDDMTEMIHPDEVLSLIASASGDERYFHVIEANEKGKVKTCVRLRIDYGTVGKKKEKL